MNVLLAALLIAADASNVGPNKTVGPCTDGLAYCQVHLAFGGDPGSLIVSWVSRDNVAQPSVRWGSSAEALHDVVNASTSTYALDDFCQPGYVALRGWEDPGFLHHAVVRPALSGPLFYAVGDAASGSWGDTIGPVGAPGVTKRGQGRTSFVAFGDMGTYAYAPSRELGACDDETAAALSLVRQELDLVMHVGDIAYANDGPQSRWRYFMEEIAGTASVVPWMVGCGNHDCLWPIAHPNAPPWPGSFLDAGGDGGQCGVAYDARFRMPGDPSRIATWAESRGGTVNNLFYGFAVGLVHFVVLSSEHALPPGSTQHAWLAEHLAAVERDATPFVVLGLHRPVYTSTAGGASAAETLAQQAALEPLLVAHRVTAVVAGHYHQYERSCALARGACVDPRTSNGTVHVLAGIAGVTHDEEWTQPTPVWVRAQSRGRFGYARFDVLNRTHLHLKVVQAKDGSIIDEAVLHA